MAMQSQQQQTRPESPSDNSFNPSFSHHNLKPSLHSADPLFNLHSQQNPNHAMYNNIQFPPDYSSDLEKQSSAKMNGFAPYRTPASFNSFPNSNNRPRHPTTSSLSSASFYPTAADVFPSGPPLSHMTSPTLQHQLQQNSYDLHQTRGFDFNGSQQSNIPKQSYGLADPFANGPSSALLQSHQVGGAKSLHSVQQQHSGYQASFVNGLHIQSQTPYGPHLQTNGTSVNGAAGSGSASSMNHVNGVSAPPNPSQEEISTIFVVGFPEDMQEREFQNMFTFSAGFEAATLKIPNKEYTSYGGTATAPPGGSMRPGVNGLAANYPYSGPNDPYNLVTVNQGGVVVDGGRDGTMASWPASVPGMAQDDVGGHFVPGGGPSGGVQSMPPRKQIIGFAKFRSRPDALEARDVLQGRRVDIEKGAVLKAEMAKKNLHTKRGVGPLPMPPLPSMSGGGAGLGPSTNEALGLASGGIGAVSGLGSGVVETMSIRERGDLGALGAVGLSQWREASSRMENNRAEEEERERKRDREAGVLNAMGLGATRGPRERAEEDERERDRRRKEKEARLRSNGMTLFDAIHSVPPVISRHTSTSTGMLSPGSGPTDNGTASPMMDNGFSHSLIHSSAPEEISESVGPWDGRKMSMTLSATPTVPLSRQSSPPSRDQENASTFSPSSNCNAPLPQRMFSPSLDDNQRYTPQETPQFSSQEVPQYPLGKRPPICSSSQPVSSASSVTGGSQSSHIEGDISRGFSGLAVTTNHGNTSPQLPSPASGASSTSTRNIVDQNPPINTLYVGNLPTSQVPSGYPPNYLEESLRELFHRRPGFRKLCFRQKSNGPMCFVEFDDVSFATKTLNDLYGNTLGGLIKGGGIRLSYSKNPLGVRTPTSAGSNGPSLQQQQLQNNQASGVASPFAPDAFQSRSSVDASAPSVRRENAVTSPPPSYSYMMSSPPPRFFSPTPSSNTSTFPRANQHLHGYTLPSGNSNMSSFSPFGVSTPQHSTIPDRTSSDPHDHHFAQGALSSANNIEAARAG